MTAFIFPDHLTTADFGEAGRLAVIDQISPEPMRLTVHRIVTAVAARFGLTKSDILSRRRARRYGEARQAVMLIAHRHTKLSSAQIGRYLDRDHTTVLHGITAAQYRSYTDPDYERYIRDIVHYLKREGYGGFEHIGDVGDRVVAKTLEARRAKS